MSAYHGRYHRGAAAIRRQAKHAEAVERNAATLPENRSKKQPVSRHARREAGQ
jgi:hypothetical protein